MPSQHGTQQSHQSTQKTGVYTKGVKEEGRHFDTDGLGTNLTW